MDKEVRIGLVGFGVVGSGFVQCMRANEQHIASRVGLPVRIKTIADLDIVTPRNVSTMGIQLTTDVREILDDPDIDIVVELVGGTTFAYDVIMDALMSGKHVVTANKALLAHKGNALFRMAEKQNRLLMFEAAVGGGIPIIQAMRTGLCSTRIDRIYGILNGTANYILTRMDTAELEFETALIEAKAKGYAEADPTYDIEGHDTCHKILLLAEIAFGCEIHFDDIYREGITRLTSFDLKMARELGYKVKLLAMAKRKDSSLEIRVHPVLIPVESQLAAVSGVFNAVVVEGYPLGTVMFYGPGAGGPATGTAVAADVMDISRAILRGETGPSTFLFGANQFSICPMGDCECAYYLKLMVKDQPGVLSRVTKVLGDEAISIASFIQKESHEPHNGVPIVLCTHRAKESSMLRAVEKIAALEAVVEQPFLLRIETFEN